jgi:nucleotidyltransferase/DNA polymerase involved in DNA repair
MALIGHLDSDCFYVSCERVRTPALARQPAAILGNQGACVIARSYEIRPFGVRVGMPVWDAVKLCPHAIFIKRDFRWYEVLSRQLLHTLQSVSPATEYYSVDEMFFDAQSILLAFRLPLHEAIQALQKRILEQVRIPVTIGVSFSKTLAKLASDTAKPFGCAVLTERLQLL